MQTKTVNILAGVLAVIALVVSLIAWNSSGVPGRDGRNGQDGRDGTSLGAVPTLDGVDNPYMRISGQREYRDSIAFSGTSSIPVMIKNPFSATTSIDYAMVEITSGVAGTNTFDLSTTSASTGYGSSTPALVYAHSVATKSQDTFVWPNVTIASTSPLVNGQFVLLGTATDGSSKYLLGPSEWLTLRIATSSAGTFGSGYYQGTLNVIFRR